MDKPKKYYLYSMYESTLILFGWGVVFIALLVYIFIKMHDAGYSSEDIGMLLLPLFGLWVVLSISMVRSGLAYRLLLQIGFDNSGIHYYILGFPISTMYWADIHTFGICGYSVSYIQRELILFSTNKQEFAPKNIQDANRVSKDRIIIQYRKDAWQAMQQYLPADIRNKLSCAIEKKQDCFHKR